MAYSISKEYTFIAGHRLEGHPKCGRLHGHNYVIVVMLSCDTLDHAGMVLDYGDMDVVVKPIVDAIDHHYIVSQSNKNAGDPYAKIAIERGDAYEMAIGQSTAESLSEWFRGRILNAIRANSGALRSKIDASVMVKETPKSTAMWVPNGEAQAN